MIGRSTQHYLKVKIQESEYPVVLCNCPGTSGTSPSRLSAVGSLWTCREAGGGFRNAQRSRHRVDKSKTPRLYNYYWIDRFSQLGVRRICWNRGESSWFVGVAVAKYVVICLIGTDIVRRINKDRSQQKTWYRSKRTCIVRGFYPTIQVWSMHSDVFCWRWQPNGKSFGGPS